MPYIGNTIRAADDYRLIDDISSSFNGSTTSFALQVAGSAPVPFPKSPQQVLISVNGVIQEPDPTGASGFNLVGTNIVFSSAPTNGHAFFGIIYATADYLNAGGNFPSGSLGAPSFTFIGDENTGLYRKSGGSVGFVSDATEIANFDSNGITISSGNFILGDSSGANDDRIKLGASGDLEIYHDGSHSRIVDSGTGRLSIQSNDFRIENVASSELMAKFVEDGAVELYHNNSKKAETVTGGFTVTGVCTATSFAGDGSSLSGINTDLVSDTSPQLGGNLDVNTKNIVFGDSGGTTDDRLVFGASSDLQIYHNGNESKIEETGTGNLRINTSALLINNQAQNETLAQFLADGAVELYHNNVKKFETASTGITITGGFTTSGGSAFNSTISFNDDASFFGASHHVFFDRSESAFEFQDNAKATFGTGNDLQIFHDGTHSRIVDNGANATSIQTNLLRIHDNSGNFEYMAEFNANGAVELYHDNSKKFETKSNGVHISTRLDVKEITRTDDVGTFGTMGGIHFSTKSVLPMDSNGTVINNDIELGSASYRWKNIYTNDLHLSNQGSSNDVDQTWGDYTIQEGFEDLYLINNRTGKKFKFNLTEVG